MDVDVDMSAIESAFWGFHLQECCVVEGYLKPSLVLRGNSVASQLLNSFLGPVEKEKNG
jgi:hypothetical protein